MIRYALHCDKDHAFDSWFQDSAAFEKLAGAGALSCPHCGSAAVSKALMAPSLGKQATPPTEASPQQPIAAEEKARAVMPEAEKLRALLREMRRKVEEHCDYVGTEFAEEARRIHYGEAERRGIYGEASAEDAEALAEEGVDVARIPWLPRDDA